MKNVNKIARIIRYWRVNGTPVCADNKEQAIQLYRDVSDIDVCENLVVEQTFHAIIPNVVTFQCINREITMTIDDLINYYIDNECANVAVECGF